MMLKAGSLVYALAIALLVSAISGALIMLGTHFKLEQQRYTVSSNLIDNANSGLLFLQHHDESHFNSSFDLYDNGTDSVQLFKRPWGFFDVAVSTANHQGSTYTKTALLGTPNRPELTTSFYMCDHGKPLKLCGVTRLSGTCYLPKTGVERAYIEGQNYVGEQLIYGVRQESNRRLPEANASRINSVIDYLRGNFAANDSVVAFDALSNDSLVHPFTKNTLLIVSNGSLDLRGGYYEGNIIFRAQNRITVGEEVHLDNVQLYASEIEFTEQSVVCVQAFSSKGLVVGNSVILSYPSVLGVVENSRSNNEYSIQIGDNVAIDGALFVSPENASPRFPAILSIGTESTLRGTAYVRGLTELKGEIHGSLYTEGLTLKTSSSIYERTLLNAVIERRLLPQEFVEAALFAESPKNGIAVWLN